MSQDLISVIDAARQIGKRKQGVFKILKRLGIETQKLRGSDARGQLVSYITQEEFQLLLGSISSSSHGSYHEAESAEADSGFFYLIQLEPEHDPGRFKVGFTYNMAERLRSHRCSAPFSKVIKTWPCRPLWEKTAIDCVSVGCERLHTEVFRTESIDETIQKCDNFFNLIPSLSEEEDS
ncbi:MAG: hypothetical protein WCD18_07820 [Thermosynechococcaceae cyanobacterium]